MDNITLESTAQFSPLAVRKISRRGSAAFSRILTLSLGRNPNLCRRRGVFAGGDPLNSQSHDQSGSQEGRIGPEHLQFPLVDQLLDFLQGFPLFLQFRHSGQALEDPFGIEAVTRGGPLFFFDKPGNGVIVNRLTGNSRRRHHLTDLEQFSRHLAC